MQPYLDYSFSKSFDNVVKRYDRTKPVVSKYHTHGDDIRPFGNRRKKFERIEKISNNKYAIHDGSWRSSGRLVSTSNTPMVWERTKRGDVLTIRTGAKHDNARIAFLNYALPPVLELCKALEGHNIRIFAGHPSHRLLPGHTLVSPESPVSTHYLPRCSRGDEEYNLQFLHRGNTFECISGGYPIPRKRVNKAKKAALKVPLEEFYVWVCDIGKLLPYDDSGYRNRQQNEVFEYRKEGAHHLRKLANISSAASGVRSLRILGSDGLTTPLALEIIKDYNHPLRTHLACHFLQRTNSVTIHDIDSKDDASRFRLSFNRWANEALGLIEVVTIS